MFKIKPYMKKLTQIILFIFLITGCSDETTEIVEHNQTIKEDKKITKTDGYNENRNLYFGDTHIHTSYSFDAYLLGNTNTPNQAYRYAKGESVKNSVGIDMVLKEPLDFYAVTDHGLFLGVVNELADPNSKIGKLEGAKPFHNINSPENLQNVYIDRSKLFRESFGKVALERVSFWAHPITSIRGLLAFKELNLYPFNILETSKYFDKTAHLSAWKDVAYQAEIHNDPGTFTTFIGYEWTISSSLPESASYHRNVLFSSSKAPKRPFTRFDSIYTEDLWNWMDELREKGLDSLAIPHNSNQSNGQTFRLSYSDGNPLDLDYANQRNRNEPLVEITQIKGTSETHPRLSPKDEWAGFEILNTRKGNVSKNSNPHGSYVREAYLNGMSLEKEGRGNPFKFGVIGSSDNHNSSGSYEEDNYFGSTPITADPLIRSSIPYENGLYAFNTRGVQFGASGLAAVWAEENTRSSIFSAFKRKETYGTSGNRIKLRFFAGYGIEDLDLRDPDLIEKAYKKGVPMGADIILKSTEVPGFLIWAQKDLHGAPLQRIQIIKGWYDDGYQKQTNEKVYDVACSDGLLVDPITNRCPDNNSWVNLKDCSISDNGNNEIIAKWKDPEFDPKVEAFYYVRVLENPSCRWSTWDAIRAGASPRDEVPSTIQERAWSSPIWTKIIQ